MSRRVTVVGTGYVGLVTGVCLAHSGHDVTCVDVDAEKVAMLAAGRTPIHEPGIEDLLAEGLASGRLRFATPAGGWAELLGEIVFVAVGTPSSATGAADLSQVRSVVELIATQAASPLTLVVKSTVPPGTGALLRERYLSRSSVGIGYVSNPEFLREGQAIDDWYHTDRIVLGGDDAAAVEDVASLYADIDGPVVRTDVASAETIKYASNAFLATKISFINEMANVCDCVGADIDSVAEGIGLDKRIGPHFLRAGIGYGGSCFPKDIRALDFISTLNGYKFELLKAVIEVNNRQRLLPVMRIAQVLRDRPGAKVAVLGLAFKPHTDDVRESPTLDIVPLLLEQGSAVDVYDPLAFHADLGAARRVGSVWEALDGASVALVVTEWPEFAGLDWARVASVMAEPRLVFDGRNALDAKTVTAAGCSYAAVGRPGVHRARD